MRTASRSAFPVGGAAPRRREGNLSALLFEAFGFVLFVGLVLGSLLWLTGLVLVDADVVSRSLAWWDFVRLAALFHLIRALFVVRPQRED